MGVERDAGCEPRSDAVRVVYGLTTKGNGEVILSREKHMSLSIGGGQAGQGYPAVFCLEGNGSRPSHKGDGWILGGAMYTLNGTEVHAVCYGIDLYNQCTTGGGVQDLE